MPTKYERVAQRETLVEYLKMKVLQEDWHGVADAAMDLRDHDAFESGMQRATEEQLNGQFLQRTGAL